MLISRTLLSRHGETVGKTKSTTQYISKILLLVLIIMCLFVLLRYSRNVRRRMNVRRLRTSMYRARSRTFPPVPQTLLELTQVLLQNPRVSVTVDGEQNMYAGSITADDGSHHVVFVSQRMLDFMGQCKLLQGDGTFKSRPATPESAQCFNIVTTYKDGVSVPLSIFLSFLILIATIINMNLLRTMSMTLLIVASSM